MMKSYCIIKCKDGKRIKIFNDGGVCTILEAMYTFIANPTNTLRDIKEKKKSLKELLLTLKT